MIGPAPLDITVYLGADFYLPFTLTDIDGEPVSLNGATISGKVRNDIDDAAAFLTFVGLVVSGDQGQGQLTATAAVTAALVLPASPAKKRPLTKMVWDADVLYSDGTTQRIFEGICLFSPGANK